MKKVDAVVIGAGPGGYVCAIRLAQYGKKVVLIEKHKLGGECLNYGCIPSKSLIFASSLFEKVTEGKKFGVEADNVRFNMASLQKWRENLVKKLNQGISFLLKQNKVEVLEGEAQFTSPTTIKVDKEEIEAVHFVIATGSQSLHIPGFEFDGKTVLSSKEALELSKLPHKILILGGGVIGLELGMYFSKLGVEIEVVEMMPQILPGTDKDLVHVLEKNLKKRKIEIHTSTKAKSLKIDSRLRGNDKGDRGNDKGDRGNDKGDRGNDEQWKGVTLTVEKDGKEVKLEGDILLVTIGRKAVTESLQLDKALIETDAKGFILVNPHLQTSSSHIYAIGDVTGGPLLAHKASFQGIQVANTIGRGAPTQPRPVSWAIFTDPEIAGVGLNEAQAVEQGHEAQVGKFPFAALGRASAVGETEGFVKIVSDKNTEVVLGVFIVGTHASDLISEGTLAVTHKLKLEDIASTIHPHPTLPEALMEASEAALGHAIHITNH